MRLLSALAAGIWSAAGGKAEVYTRGTTQRATLYSDMEAQGPTLLSPVTLDEGGSAVLYVNEYVDVVVTDQYGSVQRRWTEADSSDVVEVISSSFVGADYRTRASAVSKPVKLRTVLERIQAAIAAMGSDLSLPFYVVTDDAYGATGDGTTKDAAAIQAAADDAHSHGGGIVLLPEGTYQCDAGLVLPYDVFLMGCGAGATVIRLDAGVDAPLISLQSYSGGSAVIADLRLEASGAVAHPAVSSQGATTGMALTVVRAILNSAQNFNCGVYGSGPSSRIIRLIDCKLYGGAHGAVDTDRGAESPTLQIVGGRLRHVGTVLSENDIAFNGGCISGLWVDNASLVSATPSKANICAGGTGSNPSVVVGSVFGPSAAAEGAITALSASGAYFTESGNHFDPGLLRTFAVAHHGSADGSYEQCSGSRLGRTKVKVFSTAGTYTPPVAAYETVHVITTSATAFTVDLSQCPPGWGLTLIVDNRHATNSLDLTVTGVWMNSGTAHYSVGSDAVLVMRLRSLAGMRSSDDTELVRWVEESGPSDTSV